MHQRVMQKTGNIGKRLKHATVHVGRVWLPWQFRGFATP